MSVKQHNLNSIISSLDESTESRPLNNIPANTVQVSITEEMVEKATQKETLPQGEDGPRSEATRMVHRAVGELGELCFNEYFASESDWDVEHRGGKTEPDFALMDGETELSVDIKTRMALAPYKTDLVAKGDLPDGLHRFYVLQWVNWADEIEYIEFEKALKVNPEEVKEEINSTKEIPAVKRKYKREKLQKLLLELINSIVIVGWADDTEVGENGTIEEWASISGRANDNTRQKLVVNKEHINPIDQFPEP